jgi:hypothetical protein
MRTLALLLAATPAWADEVSAQLDTMGPSGSWSDAASRILVTAYDADKSGRIDTPAEADAISCEAWTALDRNVRRDWDGTGVRVIYGFDDGFIWVGDAFEIAEPLRVQLATRAGGCGVSSETSNPNGDAHEQIQAASGAGAAFDGKVRTALATAFDRSADGMLDSPEELAAVPCKVWEAIELGTRAQWDGTGMRAIYGIKSEGGLIWVGDAIGVPEAQRATLDRLLVQCAVDDVTAQPMSNSTSSGPVSLYEIPEHIRSAAGSEGFDDVVAQDLLGAFDANLSGSIDTGKELKQITCVIWAAIDDGTRTQWSSGARTIYGFSKGYIWVGYAFSIDEKLRKAADKAMAKCGLQ